MSSTSKEDKGGINIANSLRPYYVFPGSALLEFPDTQGYIEYTAAETLNDTDWHKASTSRWRIDGASFGVRFNAVPLSWGPIAPSRIEVRIPDQTLWPAKLWSALDARDSVHLNRERVRSLGISSHLIKVRKILIYLCSSHILSIRNNSTKMCPLSVKSKPSSMISHCGLTLCRL